MELDKLNIPIGWFFEFTLSPAVGTQEAHAEPKVRFVFFFSLLGQKDHRLD